MKFLKAIIVVILLGAAALIMIGVFVPEIDEEIEIQIDKPMVTVFASMMNMQGLPEWVDGLKEVERTSGFLAMPGSTFTLQFQDAETSVSYQLEIFEMKPMKSVKFKLVNELMEIDGTISFEAEGTKTNLDAYFQMRGKGLLERSVLPLMKSVITDEIRQDFQNFKELQEQ